MEFEWFIEPVVSIMVIALVVTLTMIGITLFLKYLKQKERSTQS